jgi:hypothetical protein
MGLGLPAPWNNSTFMDAIKLVVDTAHKYGKIAGLHTDWFNGIKDVDWALENGFRMVTVSDTDTFIIREARAALQKANRRAKEVR